jgi:hypothetical protein
MQISGKAHTKTRLFVATSSQQGLPFFLLSMISPSSARVRLHPVTHSAHPKKVHTPKEKFHTPNYQLHIRTSMQRVPDRARSSSLEEIFSSTETRENS